MTETSSDPGSRIFNPFKELPWAYGVVGLAGIFGGARRRNSNETRSNHAASRINQLRKSSSAASNLFVPNEIHHTEGLEFAMNHPLANIVTSNSDRAHLPQNVTPATLVWYQVAFKNYRASIADDAPPLPTKNTLQQFVHPTAASEASVRDGEHLHRAMNAFCAWLHQDGHVAERSSSQSCALRTACWLF
jgi:hypothetical protein